MIIIRPTYLWGMKSNYAFGAVGVLSKRVFNRKLSNSGSSKSNVINVGIVGSGPAAFYTAHHLIAKNQNVRIDMFEKFPVPFGLVRYGVSPDHQDVKNVISTFTKTAEQDRFHFYGNVTVGRDLSFNELQSAYHVIVLAYGAEIEKNLNIPGEDLNNVFSARQFVGWYNGVPDYSQSLHPDLTCETAIVIGQGNVALDVARILISPIKLLEKTDITENALEALRRSSIKKVWLIGRRGPLQVAFTTRELREMTKLPDCQHAIDATDFQDIYGKTGLLNRPRKRLTELLVQLSKQPPNEKECKKIWGLKFLRSPSEFVGDADHKVKSVLFHVNKLEGDDENVKAVATGTTEEIRCGLVIKSIGYQSIQIDPAIPFDHQRGIVRNEKGKVDGLPGVYCSGWVQRGPVGVIVHTMNSSFETAERILDDIRNGNINLKAQKGHTVIDKILSEKGIQVVNFDQWKKIDEYEKAKGQKIGKPREKITEISKMIEVAKTS